MSYMTGHDWVEPAIETGRNSRDPKLMDSLNLSSRATFVDEHMFHDRTSDIVIALSALSCLKHRSISTTGLQLMARAATIPNRRLARSLALANTSLYHR